MNPNRAQEIRALMQVKYDLDQIALTNLNAQVAQIEASIAASHAASLAIEQAAFTRDGGFGTTSEQLAAQVKFRQKLDAEKRKLEVTQQAQRKKSATSFAKARVAKRL